jgi:hypothetical protein
MEKVKNGICGNTRCYRLKNGQVWWHIPVTPILRRLRQEDH